jgi:hypothetical protein
MAQTDVAARARRATSRLLAGVAAALAAFWPQIATAEVPPGHPSLAASSQSMATAPEDFSKVDPSLAPGTIVVEVRDQADRPLPGALVTLEGAPQSSARPSPVIHRSDQEAVARFDGLDTGNPRSYVVSVSSASGGSADATYGTQPFLLDARHGHRIRVHVFPVTNRLEDTLIGIQGMVYLELGDDALGTNVFFQVYNLGLATWRPSGVVVDLPNGYASFQSETDGSKPGFDEVVGRGARMRGFFSPGQHDTQFRFQIPYSTDGSLALSLTLPPHVGRLRVLSESAPGLQFGVSGFPDPVIDQDRSGRRVLATDRVLAKGDAPLDRITITIRHVPKSLRGATWLVLVAAMIMISGIVLGYRMRQGRLAADDLAKARSRLAEEITALDDARAQGVIGAGGYDRVRSLLLDALGEIVARKER